MMSDAWQIDPAQFPIEGSPEEQLAHAVNWAMLAPSTHNSQPWRFVVNGNRLDLIADRARVLPVVDHDGRELIISCGAALFHLRIALQHFGWQPRIELFPDSINCDLVASVYLVERRSPTREVETMFDAIAKRHTNRNPFDTRPLDEQIVVHLQAQATTQGAWLYWARGAIKESVATIIAEADRTQMSDPRFRRELAAWMHPTQVEHGDGMSSHEAHSLANAITPLIIRTFDVGGRRAARDHELAVGSPVLAVLGTELDDERAWLDTGQALSRVLLTATANGLSASFLNQPCEVPLLRGRLHETIGKSGAPQLVLRLGYAAHAQPTPRRRLGDVLRHAK